MRKQINKDESGSKSDFSDHHFKQKLTDLIDLAVH